MCSTLIRVELSKNSEIAYVEGYKAQKATIEQSLNNESLTGLERLELVKLAAELNRRLGEKKEKSELWEYAYLKGIYDSVEYINLS